MARADRFTIESKKLEYYSDFSMNLDFHPSTGDVARFTNEDSIKQAIKNLILINYGELPYSFTVGSKISHSLFEMNDQQGADLVESLIRETLRNNEPRIEVNQVRVSLPQRERDFVLNAGIDDNSIGVTIVYTIINTSQVVELDLIIARVR